MTGYLSSSHENISSVAEAPPGSSEGHTGSYVEKLRCWEELGSGTFGRVFLVADCSTGVTRALKRTQKWKRKESREVLCHEIGRESPNLISAEEVFYTYTPAGFIVQNILMEDGGTTLHRFLSNLKTRSQQTLEASKSIEIAKQLCKGIEALHSRAIAHRDLKSENILIKDIQGRIHVKICDFGSSKLLTGDSSPSMPYICSRWYRAPELLLGSTYYTVSKSYIPLQPELDISSELAQVAVDLWSLGCVLAELLLGRPLLECEPPGRDEGKGTECPGEPYQILKIAELLGAPSRLEAQALCEGCPPAAKDLCKALFQRIDGLTPLPLRPLLLSVSGGEYEPLVDTICRLLRWNPHERVSAREILQAGLLELRSLRD